MELKEKSERFEVGAKVIVKGSSLGPVRVVELRGPLGPNGILIYRVKIRNKPKATYLEVREDQLEAA